MNNNAEIEKGEVNFLTITTNATPAQSHRGSSSLCGNLSQSLLWPPISRRS